MSLRNHASGYQFVDDPTLEPGVVVTSVHGPGRVQHNLPLYGRIVIGVILGVSQPNL